MMDGAVLLLVDTCGERASVALTRGDEVVKESTLAERAASTGLLAAVRDVLAAAQVTLQRVDAVGVVNGPGSFTGVRVGLAACKGLCEAADLRLVAVSRLEVLAVAAELRDGFAVLRAGRDQAYVREVVAGVGRAERLLDVARLREAVGGGETVCAEEGLLPVLREAVGNVRYLPITAADAWRPVQRHLAEGESDLAQLDANYVRDEETIYARAQRR